MHRRVVRHVAIREEHETPEDTHRRRRDADDDMPDGDTRGRKRRRDEAVEHDERDGRDRSQRRDRGERNEAYENPHSERRDAERERQRGGESFRGRWNHDGRRPHTDPRPAARQFVPPRPAARHIVFDDSHERRSPAQTDASRTIGAPQPHTHASARGGADRAAPDESAEHVRFDSSIPWKNARALLGVATAGFRSPPVAPLLRLHEEVLDFAAFLAPVAAETDEAERGLFAVLRVVADFQPSASVEIFGSRATSLSLPDSDWDVAVFGLPSVNERVMYALANAFRRAGIAAHVEVIASAKVPLVKVTEAGSGVGVDLSFGVESAVLTRTYIKEMLKLHSQMRPLILVIKYFLAQRGLNETYKGGVGSFLVALMVLHVIQRARAEFKADGGSMPSEHDGCLNLGALLVSFLELFGYNLNYDSTGITLRGAHGGYFSKKLRGWWTEHRPSLLSVENPCDPSSDVGKNSWNVAAVRQAFAFAHTQVSRGIRAWNAVMTQNDAAAAIVERSEPPRSLLATIIRVDDVLVDRARFISRYCARAAEPVAAAASAKTSSLLGARSVTPIQLRGIDDGLRLFLGDSADAAAPAAPALVPAGADADKPTDREDDRLQRAVTPPLPPVENKIFSLVGDAGIDTDSLARAAMQELRDSGVPLRHTRLLADVMTRKARKVDQLVQSSVHGTWHV